MKKRIIILLVLIWALTFSPEELFASSLDEAKSIYRQKLASLKSQFPNRDSEYQKAKQEAWRQYQADMFKLTGDTTYIEEVQDEAILRMGKWQLLFYSGKIDDATYRQKRIEDVALWYANQLKKNGLATDVFSSTWIQTIADATLLAERNIVPPKTTGLSNK